MYLKAFFIIWAIAVLPSTDPGVERNYENPGSDICDTTNDVFQDGESLTYKLYYNLNFVWVPAGEVIFQVAEEEDHFRLSAYGRTYPSYEWFYKVDDYYESKVDKATLLPTSHLRDIHEGSYTKYEKVHFDQENHVARTVLGRSKEKTKSLEIDIQDCIHDVLSVVYYTRNVDIEGLAKGDQFPVRVYMNKDLYDLDVTFEGRHEKKKIKGLGKFRTLEVRPPLVNGHLFKEGTEMKVWVSDDRNRVPLLIESPVTVGSVKAVLMDYKGLKYDMTSKW